MIQDESIKVVYKGDGVNAVFDYPYALDSESLIICYIYDNQGDELITAGHQFKDGTTTSVERNDKKLTVKVDNKAPTDRYDITLTRTTPTDQLTDLPNVYPYNDIEKSLDKTTLQMQELKDAQSRALKVSEDVNVDVVLPKPKPNSVYAWNDAADKLVSLALDTTATAEEFNRLGDDIKKLLAETTQFHDMANEQYDMANEQYQELLAKYSQLQATFDAMYVRQDGTKFMTDSLSIKNPNRYSGINLYDTDGSHVDIENCIDSNNIVNIIQRDPSNQTVAKVTIPKKTGDILVHERLYEGKPFEISGNVVGGMYTIDKYNDKYLHSFGFISWKNRNEIELIFPIYIGSYLGGSATPNLKEYYAEPHSATMWHGSINPVVVYLYHRGLSTFSAHFDLYTKL